MKQCCRCHLIKEDKLFYKNSAAPDKLSHACKECTYTRKKKKYDPISAQDMYEHLVVKNDGCWGWLGTIRGGYGSFGYGNKVYSAHRFSYELYIGPIPDGLFVLHKCDNPICSNPSHLFTGTNADNHLDMVNKKRHRFGENGTLTKLNTEQVIDIRNNCIPFDENYGYGAFARKYNVHAATIRQAYLGETWKHL